MKWIVTFFGAGLVPKMPGTAGTLAAVPFALLLSQFGPLIYMSAVFILVPIAVICSDKYEKSKGGHDHPEIVIDEVVGLLITYTWLPSSWQSIVYAFLLFRVLDILKPFPIGMADRKIKGGLGVVADDVIAGIIGNIILQTIYYKTTWLGSQWLPVVNN